MAPQTLRGGGRGVSSWSWIWIWWPISRLTGRPGRSTMASPTTLHIGRPCDVITPRTLMGDILCPVTCFRPEGAPDATGTAVVTPPERPLLFPPERRQDRGAPFCCNTVT